MRLVSWNIKCLLDAWRELAKDPSVDVALLQEAKPPPGGLDWQTEPPRDSECRWTMPGWTRVFRTAIARLSERVTMRGRRTGDLATARGDIVPVSRVGTLAVADVAHAGETITCISAYAPWENLLHDPPRDKPVIFSDASAHRLLSDISALITSKRHKLLIAGDFNLLHGYGENGHRYWARRYASFFARVEALGLRFVGPQAPHGRQATPWPRELPSDTMNVPTFYSSQQAPESASRQLDFVFASESIAERVSVRAMNGVDEWGPSDHCRIVIDVAPEAFASREVSS
jgi:exonuclease III